MDNENKYTLNIEFRASKKIDGDILWEVIKDAFLSYAKQTRAELFVSKAFVEERNHGSVKE